MSWKISRITTSIMGLLRDSEDGSQMDNQLEDIREEMLGCMMPCVKGLSHQPAVWAKVMYANDIQSLWYHRSDVMVVLCEHLGETQASLTMARITAMFRGAVPATQLKAIRFPGARR